MKISKKGLAVFLIIAFLLGWYLGLWAENWTFITLSFDVPAINLFTTALTLGVTVYVAKIIQKSVQDRKSQNQLLIKRLDDIEKMVCEIEQLTGTDGFSYIALLARLKILYISLKRVEDEIHRVYPQLNSSAPFETTLTNVHQIQNAATYVTSNSREIVVEGDRVKYTQAKRNEIYTLLSFLKDKIFDIQVAINRQ